MGPVESNVFFSTMYATSTPDGRCLPFGLFCFKEEMGNSSFAAKPGSISKASSQRLNVCAPCEESLKIPNRETYVRAFRCVKVCVWFNVFRGTLIKRGGHITDLNMPWVYPGFEVVAQSSGSSIQRLSEWTRLGRGVCDDEHTPISLCLLP